MDVVLALAAGSGLFFGALAALRRLDPAIEARVSALSAASGPAGPDVDRLGSRWRRGSPKPEARLARRLVLAGRDGRDREHRRTRARGALAGGAAGLALGGPWVPGIALGSVLALAGRRLPDVRLARAARRRQAAIARRVGDLCEVLGACVRAGLGPAASLDLAAGGLHGPLAEELRRALGLIGVGARWRDVLDELCARTEAAGLVRLRAALRQSERLGTSLEAGLRELAGDERAERRAAAEARARAAPVKLLFPLVLLILPAFLLLTVVPVVLATLRSLG